MICDCNIVKVSTLFRTGHRLKHLQESSLYAIRKRLLYDTFQIRAPGFVSCCNIFVAYITHIILSVGARKHLNTRFFVSGIIRDKEEKLNEDWQGRLELMSWRRSSTFSFFV